jgi:nitroreductase
LFSPGFSSLWFTMFDKDKLKEILGIDVGKIPLAIIQLGKVAAPAAAPPRKSVGEMVRYIR